MARRLDAEQSTWAAGHRVMAPPIGERGCRGYTNSHNSISVLSTIRFLLYLIAVCQYV